MRLGNGTLADLALRLGKQEYSPARAAGAVSERAWSQAGARMLTPRTCIGPPR